MGAYVATAGVVVFLIATFLDWVSTEDGSVTGSGYETDSTIPLIAFLGLGLVAGLLYALNRARGRQHRGLSLTTMAAGIAAAGLALSYLLDAPGALERGATTPPRSAPGSPSSARSSGPWARSCWPRSPRATTTGTAPSARPGTSPTDALTSAVRGATRAPDRCTPRVSVPELRLRGGHPFRCQRGCRRRWWVFTPYMARSARPISSSGTPPADRWRYRR